MGKERGKRLGARARPLLGVHLSIKRLLGQSADNDKAGPAPSLAEEQARRRRDRERAARPKDFALPRPRDPMAEFYSQPSARDGRERRGERRRRRRRNRDQAPPALAGSSNEQQLLSNSNLAPFLGDTLAAMIARPPAPGRNDSKAKWAPPRDLKHASSAKEEALKADRSGPGREVTRKGREITHEREGLGGPAAPSSSLHGGPAHRTQSAAATSTTLHRQVRERRSHSVGRYPPGEEEESSEREPGSSGGRRRRVRIRTGKGAGDAGGDDDNGEGNERATRSAGCHTPTLARQASLDKWKLGHRFSSDDMWNLAASPSNDTEDQSGSGCGAAGDTPLPPPLPPPRPAGAPPSPNRAATAAAVPPPQRPPTIPPHIVLQRALLSHLVQTGAKLQLPAQPEILWLTILDQFPEVAAVAAVLDPGNVERALHELQTEAPRALRVEHGTLIGLDPAAIADVQARLISSRSDGDAPPQRQKHRIKATPTLDAEADDEAGSRDTGGSKSSTDGKQRRRRSTGSAGRASPAETGDAPPRAPGKPSSTPKAAQQDPTPLSPDKISVATANDRVAKVGDCAGSSSAPPNVHASGPQHAVYTRALPCASRTMCAEMKAQALSSARGEGGARLCGLGTAPPPVLRRGSSRGSRKSGLIDVKMSI